MSQDELAEVTIHRRRSDPCDESWHASVSKEVHSRFGGKRTLWNSAWIEYNVYRSQVDALVTFFGDQGFKVTVDDGEE